MLDDDERRHIRQELLEAVSVGMGGPLLAPMPGVMIEMLEIAAMERRQSEAAKDEMATDSGQALTVSQNGSRMTVKLVRALKAIARVAERVGSGSGNRRLPA